MILRVEVVRQRLDHLRTVLRRLQESTAVSRTEFLESYRDQWVAERGLQLASQAVFDVGAHILTARLNVNPTDYEDVIRRLGEHGVISEALRDRLKGLGGFRNILVHGYLDLDAGRIYDFAASEVDAMIQFADEVERFIASPE
jgi:uncharacterized protein YutE (UPF0331/DUF86 family)